MLTLVPIAKQINIIIVDVDLGVCHILHGSELDFLMDMTLLDMCIDTQKVILISV